MFFSVTLPLCFVVVGLFPTAFPNYPLYFSSAAFFPPSTSYDALFDHCAVLKTMKHAAGCTRLFPLHAFFFWHKAESRKNVSCNSTFVSDCRAGRNAVAAAFHAGDLRWAHTNICWRGIKKPNTFHIKGFLLHF